MLEESWIVEMTATGRLSIHFTPVTSPSTKDIISPFRSLSSLKVCGSPTRFSLTVPQLGIPRVSNCLHKSMRNKINNCIKSWKGHQNIFGSCHHNTFLVKNLKAYLAKHQEKYVVLFLSTW